jgi:hypothetical protein
LKGRAVSVATKVIEARLAFAASKARQPRTPKGRPRAS